MKSTADFIQEIKVKYDLKSNYAVAKLLDQTDTAIARWSKGKSTFSDESAIHVAKLLDLDPAYVVACVHAERAKPSEEKKLWERIAAMMQTKEAAGLAAALAVFMILPTTDFSDHGFNLAFVGMTAAPSISSTWADFVYYVKFYWPLIILLLPVVFYQLYRKR